MKLLRGDNIVQGQLRWEDVKKWPIADTEEYKDYELREGDVVLAMDRTWVKAGIKYAVLSSEDVPCLLVQRTARLRARKTLHPKFLRWLIGSEKLLNTFFQSKPVAVSHISVAHKLRLLNFSYHR